MNQVLPIPTIEKREPRFMSGHMVLVVCVLLAAFVVRFVGLDQYPPPIHQDELSNIYDGYSIATTGADRTGARWPFIVRAMGPGDFRPAMYAYLAALSTGLWGFSVWAGRVPAAVVGCLTVVLVYLLARRALGLRGALLATVFAACSPVLIQYSRQAHEGGCLPPFFGVAIVYCLYRAVECVGAEKRGERTRLWSAIAGLTIGLSTNAYGAQRMTAALLAILGAVLLLQAGRRAQRGSRHNIITLLAYSVAVLVGAAPQILAMFTQSDDFFARSKYLALDWHNGPGWVVREMAITFVAHFDPRVLFAPVGSYAELTFARLNLVAAPFFYVGLVAMLYGALIKRRVILILIMMAVVISILPAAVTKSNHAIMRASGVWSLHPLIIALGAVTIGRGLWSLWSQGLSGQKPGTRAVVWNRNRVAGVLTAALMLAVIAESVYDIQRFVVLCSEQEQQTLYQTHFVRIAEWVRQHGRDYDRVYVDAPGAFGYLYLAAFTGMTPEEFQHAPREGFVSVLGWEKLRRFGRYHFATLEQADSDWKERRPRKPWLYINANGESVVFDAKKGKRRQYVMLESVDPTPTSQ